MKKIDNIRANFYKKFENGVDKVLRKEYNNIK